MSLKIFTPRDISGRVSMPELATIDGIPVAILTEGALVDAGAFLVAGESVAWAVLATVFDGGVPVYLEFRPVSTAAAVLSSTVIVPVPPEDIRTAWIYSTLREVTAVPLTTTSVWLILLDSDRREVTDRRIAVYQILLGDVISVQNYIIGYNRTLVRSDWAIMTENMGMFMVVGIMVKMMAGFMK